MNSDVKQHDISRDLLLLVQKADECGVGMVKMPKGMAEYAAKRIRELEAAMIYESAEVVQLNHELDDAHAKIEEYRDCKGWRTRKLAHSIREMCERHGFVPTGDDVWGVAESAYAPLPPADKRHDAHRLLGEGVGDE